MNMTVCTGVQAIPRGCGRILIVPVHVEYCIAVEGTSSRNMFIQNESPFHDSNTLYLHIRTRLYIISQILFDIFSISNCLILFFHWFFPRHLIFCRVITWRAYAYNIL